MRSLTAARAALDRGEAKALDLVEACLARIERFEPRIHAWVRVEADAARDAARRLDAAAAAGAAKGPLHGIPLGVKDIVDVASMPTLAGSKLRSGCVAAADAPIVARLRSAGAVILGKTVTTPWACFDPSPTRNPWNAAHTPGGSSSGSAAAVALGMCWAAVGTQTGGSIIRPASYCGVAGFKPSRGAIPSDGVVPVSPSLDQLGFLAREIADFAPLLSATAEPNMLEPASARDAGGEPRLAPRIGVLRPFYWRHADEQVLRAADRSIERLAAAGATISDVPAFDDHESALARHQCLMAYEAADYHRASFAASRDHYGPRMQELLDEGLQIDAAAYREALSGQAAFRAAVHRALEGRDAILIPAAPTAAPADLSTTGSALFNKAWSYAGTPAVSTPCGMTSDGLPLAIQLIGRHRDDRALLQTAAWCEQALGGFAVEPPLADG